MKKNNKYSESSWNLAGQFLSGIGRYSHKPQEYLAIAFDEAIAEAIAEVKKDTTITETNRQYAVSPGWYWIKCPGFGPVIAEVVWKDDECQRFGIWNSFGFLSHEGEYIEFPLGSDVRGPLEAPF